MHLTSLRAAGCPGLTLNAMQGFPELRHLDLSSCDCIAPATAVRSCLSLSHLYKVLLTHLFKMQMLSSQRDHRGPLHH